VIDNVLESLLSDEKLLKIPPKSQKTTYDRPRSCSTKPSSCKIRQHRTFNEKDLIRPLNLKNNESGKSSKKTTNTNTTSKPQQQSSTKSIVEKQPGYNKPGNRVSFQPTTEFLKQYPKGVDIAKQGAATASGIKRTASTSLTLKKSLLLPKSESAASCLKNDQNSKRNLLNTGKKQAFHHHHTVNISKLIKTANRNISTLELNASSKNMFKAKNCLQKNDESSSIEDENASDCSTIGDVNIVRGAAICKLIKNCSLNVPKNISKSVDSVLSCVPGDEMEKKSRPEIFLK